MSKEQFREIAKKLYRVERELRRFEGTADTQTSRLPAKTWRLSGSPCRRTSYRRIFSRKRVDWGFLTVPAFLLICRWLMSPSSHTTRANCYGFPAQVPELQFCHRPRDSKTSRVPA